MRMIVSITFVFLFWDVLMLNSTSATHRPTLGGRHGAEPYVGVLFMCSATDSAFHCKPLTVGS